MSPETPPKIRAMDANKKPGEIPGTTDFILSQLWLIASADLTPRRNCCRCCWGEAHDYQRTPREYRLHIEGGGKPEGGSGYNALKPPHPDCPECFGQGVPATDKPVVSAAAKLRALDLLGRDRGLFKTRNAPRERYAQDAQCREEMNDLRIAREAMLASGESQDDVDQKLELHHPETWRLLQLEEAIERRNKQQPTVAQAEEEHEYASDGVTQSRLHLTAHGCVRNPVVNPGKPQTAAERRAKSDYALDVVTPDMVPFELNEDERWWFNNRGRRPYPVPRRIMEHDFSRGQGPP